MHPSPKRRGRPSHHPTEKQSILIPRGSSNGPSIPLVQGTRAPTATPPDPLMRSREPWAAAVELKVRIGKLPKSWGTLDIYKTFVPFGNLIRIELFEPRGHDTINGYVIFRPPPPSAPWICRGLGRRDEKGVTHRIECSPDEPKGEYRHPSPVDPMRLFPQNMSVGLEQLDFGVMCASDEMLALKTALPPREAPLELTLDMQRKRVELNFSFCISSPSLDQHQPAVRERFRITVEFSQIERIYQLKNATSEAFVIQLKMPPFLFRKTNDIESTHDSGSNSWSERQTWYRQTSIYENSSSRPLQLQQENPSLDAGRWLTYRLVLNEATATSQTFLTMSQALIDHNIDIITAEMINIVTGDAQAMWQWASQKAGSYSLNSSFLAELHQMSTRSAQLDFAVRYQLDVCISQGILHECNITSDFIQKLATVEPYRAIKTLEKIADFKQRYFNPMDIFKLQNQVSVKRPKIPRYCTKIPSAIVTPTTIYFATPVLETSNRVIRQFRQHEDRFLRVRFTDERYRGKVIQDYDNTSNEIYNRVKKTMNNGVQIGDRLYEFLAFGNSQFREHGAYFFASTGVLTADMIRQWMGDFTTIRVVAKYASRIGQCFSTTRAMSIGVKIERIPDIKHHGFCFSDGVGKISTFLAQMIAEEFGLPLTDYPSVFQIRLGGCKGVLAVDPETKGQTVCIRPSQEKFAAKYYGLEVCRLSQFSTAYLNMQVILVLSALGVPDWAFLTKMRAALSDLQGAMSNREKAEHELQKNVDYNQMSLTLALMVHHFMDVHEPFVKSCLSLWRSWMIKYLKEKARILVDEGAFLLGCVDETRTLKGYYNQPKEEKKDYECSDPACLPEIFLQIPDPGFKGRYRVIEGICTLARNPSLHPGDIRIVRAVDVPQLRYLKNCVVLPQTGDRDLANMCSGGDLDGDDYLVMWDNDLMPKEWNHPPMDYRAPDPVVSEGPVTVDDMTSFFVTHMKSDNLARIAVAHRYWADSERDGVKDEKCLELAQLHSRAVDFAKTGVAADMPKRLIVKRWPHWANVKGKAKGKIYTSHKILGKLYDEVQQVPFIADWDMPFDKRILDAFVLSEQMLQDAREVKQQYDEAVRRIMAQQEISSEFEVWTTFALGHSEGLNDYKFSESFGETVAGLKQHHQELCYEKAGTNAKERDKSKMDPFVAAMYRVTANEVAVALAECNQSKVVRGRRVTLRQKTFGSMPLISFPWIFHQELGRIATKQSSKSNLGLRPIVLLPKKNAKRERHASILVGDFELPELQEVIIEEGVVRGGDLLEVYPMEATKEIPNGQDMVKTRCQLGADRNPEAENSVSSVHMNQTNAETMLNTTDHSTDFPHAGDTRTDWGPEGEEREEVLITMGEKPSALSALEKLVGMV